jgi:hypothetical protein
MVSLEKRETMCRIREICALSMLILLFSCSAYTVHRLDSTKYKPRQRDAEITIYAGKVDRPHVKIAIIDSETFPDKSDATKLKQLEQLKTAARKLGADAVEDVRLLAQKVRGYVVDERVPFPAWKQGEYELYFLRGVAVRFTEETSPEKNAKQ